MSKAKASRKSTSAKPAKTITAFRFFCARDGNGVIKSVFGDHTWSEPKGGEPGDWHVHKGKLSLCNSGFHASTDIISALEHAQGEVLGEVECRGANKPTCGKFVARGMRIRRLWSEDDVRTLAVMAAVQALPLFEKVCPADARPRECILATVRHLREETDARDAARDAAWAAARDAARDAASAAASAAAWAAAWDAAWAALGKLFAEMLDLPSTEARIAFALAKLQPAPAVAVTT